MTEDESKAAVLAAVLTRGAQEGFTPSLLRAADPEGLFGQDFANLFAFWSAAIDGELERRLATLDLTALSVRKRIRAGVLARLEILKAHKEAARKAAVLPQFLAGHVETLWHAADIIWRAAGDRTTDFNFYSKRVILAGVISTTMIAWFGDDSEDEAATIAFLDARIDNVLQFEKLKARLKEACTPPGKTS